MKWLRRFLLDRRGMMTQFKILLFILCINVIAIAVLATTTEGTYMFPFVEYTHPLNSTGTLEEYEENFNGTALVDTWQPQTGFGFAGDIFSGLNMFWTIFRFLFDGLGMTLEWVGSFVPAASTAFTVIAWVLRILTAVMSVTLVIEFITGRQLME